jgi:hypothetical protein
MFYTVISEEGFCYIPNVNVVDAANINEYDAKLIKNQTITRDLVSKFLEDGAVKFKFATAQEALDKAVEIYKKMPRYRRELGFRTDMKNPDLAYYKNKYRTMNSKGVGTWESEVSDKYL